MALRIEKAFGPKMDTLLRMQTAYEIAEARDREGDIKVKRYVGEASHRPRRGLPARKPMSTRHEKEASFDTTHRCGARVGASG